jgi:hypothetical protein
MDGVVMFHDVFAGIGRLGFANHMSKRCIRSLIGCWELSHGGPRYFTILTSKDGARRDDSIRKSRLHVIFKNDLDDCRW